MDPVELLLHPVRLRLIHAFAGGRSLTTAQLAARLPDVSQATVYRHVATLADAGILELESEKRVRGFVERRYRLQRSAAAVTPARAASASKNEHRQAFATAMAVLLAEYAQYLDRPDTDPAADQVGYRQHAIWLTDDERAKLIDGLRTAVLPIIGNEPGPGRAPYLLSPILFPLATSAEDAED
jgi:DNA-binding transcriptional ArsR family regulator